MPMLTLSDNCCPFTLKVYFYRFRELRIKTPDVAPVQCLERLTPEMVPEKFLKKLN
jgi:hypothetical protein